MKVIEMVQLLKNLANDCDGQALDYNDGFTCQWDNDTWVQTRDDLNAAANMITQLQKAVEELLGCTDLNLEELDDSSLEAIENAKMVLNNIKGKKENE